MTITSFVFSIIAVNSVRSEGSRESGTMHTEYWIPAEELEKHRANILGLIEMIEGVS